MAELDDDLTRELRALGDSLDLPRAGHDLAPRVGRRLRAAPPPARRFWQAGAPRIAAGVALVVVLAVAGTLALSTGARDAVADRLGLGLVEIDTGVTVTPVSGSALQLGDTIPLAELAGAAGYQPLAPPAVLGEPDSTHLLARPDPSGSQVSYVYLPRDGLPEVAGSGVGLLVGQFPGTTGENYVRKQLGPDATLELVEVAGAPAFWISGAPHVFYVEAPDGSIHEETIRLAGNVLIWQVDGLTLRIESALARDEVIQIAASMMP